MKIFRGVVFDMDGVLVNSEPMIRACAQEAAAERAEHTRAADLAIAAGVPARPTRKAAEATNKRMDELHARGELN